MRLTLVLLALAFLKAGAQASWVVEREPVLDVTGVDGAGSVIFGYAAGGTRLSNGGLLIADRAENSIRVLDSSGRLVRSVGRAGDGPGEFQTMMWAGGCGPDSMLIWDFRRRQASMIGSSGAVARQFAVPAGDTAQAPFQFACSPGGSIAYRSAPRPVRGPPNPQSPNIMAVSAAVYRTRFDGTIAQRLGDIPAGEVAAVVSPSGGRGAAPRPLGRNASIAATNEAIVISSAESAYVNVVHNDGRTSRHELPIPLRAPTQAEFDEAIQATASMAPASMRQTLAEQLAAVPRPDRLPAISALFTDSEGLIWVQTTPPGARALDFLVVRLDGRVVARTQVPRGITIFEIGRDYVLGGYSDANDEMHVVTYRLRRR
jgi:hypothetical protein